MVSPPYLAAEEEYHCDVKFIDFFEEPPPHALYATSLGFAGIRYFIQPGGLLEAVINACGLRRLELVHQFGYLSPYARSATLHNRFDHSCNVTAIAALIAMRNDQISDAALTALQCAAICHDALTPAGGEPVKEISPADFDEDAHFHTLLATPAWGRVQRKFNIDTQLVGAIVKNEGVLGAILDLADKIAYTARDYSIVSGDAYPYYGSDVEKIRGAMTRDPDVCTLPFNIVVSQDNVFIANHLRLKNFLQLRANMFRYCYYHPRAAAYECMPAATVVNYLYHTGGVTRKQLRAITDNELRNIIADFLRRRWWQGDDNAPGATHTESFATRDEAVARELALLDEDVAFSFIRRPLLHETCTCLATFHVPTENGVTPFETVYPKDAQQLRDMMTLEKPWFLHYMRDAQVEPSIQQRLRTFRRTQLETTK